MVAVIVKCAAVYISYRSARNGVPTSGQPWAGVEEEVSLGVPPYRSGYERRKAVVIVAERSQQTD
jgi:hypothetical protein